MREIEAGDEDIVIIRKKKDQLNQMQSMVMRDLMMSIRNGQMAVIEAIRNQRPPEVRPVIYVQPPKVDVTVSPPKVNIPKQKNTIVKSPGVDYGRLSKMLTKQMQLLTRDIKKKKSTQKVVVVSKESKTSPMG